MANAFRVQSHGMACHANAAKNKLNFDYNKLKVYV